MDIKTLGDRIRQLRDDQGIGLREFARKVEISAAFLSDIEQGRRYPSEKVLKEIARGLNIAVSQLESFDSRVPIDELKRIAESNPSYGFALRTLANKPGEMDKLVKRLGKKKEIDEND